MPTARTPAAFGDMERKLREVAQLRKLWRAFRDPQERLEDEQLSHPIRDHAPDRPGVQEPLAVYGRAAVRAAIRYWWTQGDYAAIAEFAERLTPDILDDEPLTCVYIEEAAARRAAAS